MGTGERELPELVRAAETLESELQKLEAFSRSVCEIRLDSENNISNAAQELSQIADAAGCLNEAARGNGFPDVEREADALQQRVTALQKRLDVPS